MFKINLVMPCLIGQDTIAKFNGYTKYFELHLKECEWRWGKDNTTVNDELKRKIKFYNKSILV